MPGIFKKALEAYNIQKQWTELEIDHHKLLSEDIKDPRYNDPKGKHKASDELINETIENTEIYKQAKAHILLAQQGQVGYGLDKYPEPLNADTWTIIETIDHILGEGVDGLHYLVMLRIKLLGMLSESDGPSINKTRETEVAPAKNNCKVNTMKEFVDAEFIGIFQYSNLSPPSIMVGGHTGGMTAYPVAVVKIGNMLQQVKLKDILFEEGL